MLAVPADNVNGSVVPLEARGIGLDAPAERVNGKTLAAAQSVTTSSMADWTFVEEIVVVGTNVTEDAGSDPVDAVDPVTTAFRKSCTSRSTVYLQPTS